MAMACIGAQLQWTITLESFPTRHNFRCTKQDLVFCLEMSGVTVSGTVSDTGGTKIADVSGTLASSARAGFDFVRIEFRWPPADVIMIGMMFTQGRPTFHGRYVTMPAVGLAGDLLTVPVGPDTGDTGTGTGQTT
jgi:hypothetical protein